MNIPHSIYLDYNATAPIRPEVMAVMLEVMAKPSNPSSIHRTGRAAKALIEQSRRTFANALSCFPAEVIFTSSGTEANNYALRGYGATIPIAIATTEHASVLKTVPHATHLPVDTDGIVKMDALHHFLTQHPNGALISVMLANNETGVIQPIREIAAMVHQHGSIIHCDAVQAFTKIPVDMTLLAVDMLSISGHKIGAAQGVGALIVNQKLSLPSLITGGGQELNRRAGTENVAGIVGFAKAIEIAHSDTAWKRELRGWLDKMEANCAALFPHESIVMGANAPRLPNTSCLRMPHVSSETQLMQFDLAGVAISAGSACSSGRIEASHVVRAMLGDAATDDVVRVSGGWDSTQAEIEAFSTLWYGFVTKNQGKKT